jgi:hypothetical protein
MSDDAEPHIPDPVEERALRALRAADPVGDEPLPDTLRAAVLARASADARSRRQPPVVLLAVAASVALVGIGVGLAVGRATAPNPSAAVASTGGAAAVAGAPTRLEANGAPGADAAKSSTIGGWYGGATVLEPGAGIPDEGGAAPGYLLSAGTTDPAALADALAATLGVAGGVREQDGMWVAGSADWTGPVVSVMRSAGVLTWSYSDSSIAVGCAEPAVTPAAQEGAVADAATAVAPDACTPTGEPVPSADEARRLATRILDAIGLDSAGLRWTTQTDGFSATAAAVREIDGTATPIAHWFAFGPKGAVQNASGTVADLVAIPAYPTLGARSAILRAQRPGWGALLAPGGDMRIMEAAAPSTTTAPPPAPTIDGRPVAQIPIARTVATSARPTVVTWYQPDGSTLLVPGYAIAADDGSSWTVVAVAEPYVAPTGG